MKSIEIEFVGRTAITPTTSLFRFAFREDYGSNWRPGEYVGVSTNRHVRSRIGVSLPDKWITRYYSVVNIDRVAHQIEFLVTHVTLGAMTDSLSRLVPGGVLHVDQPEGLLSVDRIDRKRSSVVFVCTGSGLAPVIPIVRALLAESFRGRIHVFHSVRNPEEEMLSKLLSTTELEGIHPYTLFTRSASPTRDEPDRRITDIFGDDSGTVGPYYVSTVTTDSQFVITGNPAMVKELTVLLREKFGFYHHESGDSDILTEVYW
jgi:ferredoxin-NADP reductase